MNHDLTTSVVARKNVLNNPYALAQLEQHLALGGLVFAGETLFLKSQVANILAIDERTVDRYLASNADELKANGYRILKGKTLQNIKLAQVDDINVVDLIGAKTPSLGVFTFRALLNLAMLVTESSLKTEAPSHCYDRASDAPSTRGGRGCVER